LNQDFENIGKSGIAEGRILHFKTIPSTQKWAIEHLPQLRIGDVIWTKNQTAGIGRLHKKWFALPETCLTFSLILPSYTDNDLNVILCHILAVTVGKLLELQKIAYLYKWPNDIFVDKKKIAGIIANFIQKRSIVIAGIGINVNLTNAQINSLPVRQSINSLYVLKNKTFKLKSLLLNLIVILKENLNKINSDGSIYFINILRKHDYYTINDNLRLKIDNHFVQGTYQGIDDQGRLKIKTSNHIQKFWSGEIIKP